jgi:hypothetical protein
MERYASVGRFTLRMDASFRHFQRFGIGFLKWRSQCPHSHLDVAA